MEDGGLRMATAAPRYLPSSILHPLPTYPPIATISLRLYSGTKSVMWCPAHFSPAAWPQAAFGGQAHAAAGAAEVLADRRDEAHPRPGPRADPPAGRVARVGGRRLADEVEPRPQALEHLRRGDGAVVRVEAGGPHRHV